MVCTHQLQFQFEHGPFTYIIKEGESSVNGLACVVAEADIPATIDRYPVPQSGAFSGANPNGGDYPGFRYSDTGNSLFQLS